MKKDKNNIDSSKIKSGNIPLKVVPPKIVDEKGQQITTKRFGISISGNLPPEYIVATLPHLKNGARDKFIRVIDKENERFFQYQSEKRNQNFWLKLVFGIFIIGLIIFFILIGKDDLLKYLLNIGLALIAGSGGTILVFGKKLFR